MIEVDDRLGIAVGTEIAGLDPEALAALAGTPFYVYDLDAITRRVEALRGVLPARVELAYAIKSNPSLAVVAHLASLGVGADIASAGELELVTRAGFGPKARPVHRARKSDEELAAAVAAGIRAVTVESPRELARLEAVAGAAGRRQPDPAAARRGRTESP